jgi:RNase P/RNase MRP subunit p29
MGDFHLIGLLLRIIYARNRAVHGLNGVIVSVFYTAALHNRWEFLSCF